MFSAKLKIVLCLVATLCCLTMLSGRVLSSEDETTDASMTLKMKILSLYNDQNLDVIDEIIADDFVLHHSSFPEDIVGKEAFTGFFNANKTAFPDMKFSFDKYYEMGDMVSTVWTFEGTNEGEFNGNPPTGKKIKVWGLSINKIVDGKIAEEWISINAYDLFIQLGYLDPPPAPEAPEPEKSE